MAHTATPALLREATNAAGMSQAVLARQLDVSPSQVSRWMKGRQLPDIASCRNICKILGIEPKVLMDARQADEFAEFLDQSDTTDPADVELLQRLQRSERNAEASALPEAALEARVAALEGIIARIDPALLEEGIRQADASAANPPDPRPANARRKRT